MPHLLPVLFSLQGFEVVPLPAAQVERPRTTIPFATLGSLAIASVLYLLLHAACVHALPDLAAHELPLADAALVYGGDRFRGLIVIATSVSALGIVIGMLAMTPRYLAPLGDQDALGLGLGEQSGNAVPLRATWVTFALLVLILSASARWGSVSSLLALSSLSVTVQYGATAAALFALARKRTRSLAPRDAWPVPFALGSCLLMIAGASAREIPLVLWNVGPGIRASGGSAPSSKASSANAVTVKDRECQTAHRRGRTEIAASTSSASR